MLLDALTAPLVVVFDTVLSQPTAAPERILRRLARRCSTLARPLLAATEDERDGSVPYVLSSCGGLVHGDRLLLPHAASDASVRFARVDLPGLLDRVTA